MTMTPLTSGRGIREELHHGKIIRAAKEATLEAQKTPAEAEPAESAQPEGPSPDAARR